MHPSIALGLGSGRCFLCKGPGLVRTIRPHPGLDLRSRLGLWVGFGFGQGAGSGAQRTSRSCGRPPAYPPTRRLHRCTGCAVRSARSCRSASADGSCASSSPVTAYERCWTRAAPAGYHPRRSGAASAGRSEAATAAAAAAAKQVDTGSNGRCPCPRCPCARPSSCP
eukprot:scaffold71205_cov72-Phaeocystis_antarctica.AAC.1